MRTILTLLAVSTLYLAQASSDIKACSSPSESAASTAASIFRYWLASKGPFAYRECSQVPSLNTSDILKLHKKLSSHDYCIYKVTFNGTEFSLEDLRAGGRCTTGLANAVKLRCAPHSTWLQACVHKVMKLDATGT